MSMQSTVDRAGAARHGPLGPLRNAEFRQLAVSNALLWMTAFMETLVFGWLVLELTNSPWAVALVGFCRSFPFLLFGFMGGTMADRIGRRNVIVLAQVINFVVYLGLWTAIFLGKLQIWHLAVGSLAIGTAWSFDWPARRALLPDLIGKAQTVEAMLIENFVQGCSRMLGPFMAGVLIATNGPLGALTVMAALSGLALISVRQLSRQQIPRSNLRPLASPWKAFGETIRYVCSKQALIGVILVTAVVNMLLVPYNTLLPVFARDVLNQGPVGLGVLSSASGIGCFIGLFATHFLRKYLSYGWIFVGGTLGMALALIVFSQSSLYELSWAMLLIAGMGQACFGIMQSSIVLLTASDEMRGQTMGILVLAIGCDPLGKLITGAMAEGMGAPLSVGLQAAVGVVLLLAIGIFLPGLRVRYEAARS